VTTSDYQIGWTAAAVGLAYQNAGIDNTSGRHAIEGDQQRVRLQQRAAPNRTSAT
jgi:hypothetical protein